MKPLEEILKEVSKENIIDEIKNALQEKDPDTYNEWKEDEFNINHVFYGKATLLHLAAKCGVIKIARVLIESGADVNALGNSVRTPLHYAVWYGEVKAIGILIENGANVNAADEFGYTPLHTAVQVAPIEEFEETHLYRTTQETTYIETIVIKALIENGANVNLVNNLRETPLHFASISNRVSAVRVLMENGANVNVVNNLGETPIHLAAQEGCIGVIQILMENGANINVINEYDEDTPLHLAAQNNHLETVKYLIDKGADVNAKNINRKTPLDCAKEKGYEDIVEYLTDTIIKMPHNKEKVLQAYQDDSLDNDIFLTDCHALQKKKIDERKEKKPLKKKSGCLIQSYRMQQKEFVSHYLPNAEIKAVRQGLYLPSFEERGVETNGKCVAITRGLSQALFLQSSKSFLSNLETSAEIYERIAQGKQISKREEREVFAFSKLFNVFEQQLDSSTNSLPLNLIHIQSYKTLSDLSNYITEVKGDFAIHLVTSNHVVAIYRIDDDYAYFDSNTAFVSGLKSVDQLIKVIEKGIKSAGYKVEKEGLLVEHFDVEQANKLLSSGDRQVLAKEIKTERQLLVEQDKELGLIKVNGQELSRVQLYDFGTKINVEGSVPLLINAGMNLSSEKLQDLIDKEEVSMTAREYLGHLKDSKNVEEVVQATKTIPFIGSDREVKDAEQTRKPLLEQLAKGIINCILAAVSLTSASWSKNQLPEKAGNEPQTYLNDPTADNQLQKSL